jgi:hypothetical protein
MNISAAQINKLNKKVATKYPNVNVAFSFHGRLQAKYTEMKQTKDDVLFFMDWNSLAANAKSFDDVYYTL